uniref:glycerol-1-phosphatase n=1 Tax=Oryza punctata TaxID=4537 RepID=A0A0E0LST0_ORYPU
MASAASDEGNAAVPRAAVSHVIFDMDGLLLGISLSSSDTEGFYTEVQEKILARYGKVFDWSLKAKMMGKKATESARIFVDECGLDGLLTPEQFLEERESMLQELFPSCAVMPGDGTSTIFIKIRIRKGYKVGTNNKIVGYPPTRVHWRIGGKGIGGGLEWNFRSCRLLSVRNTVTVGVLRLIHHLHANGVPMAVATGSHKRHFTLKTQNHKEMFTMMHHVVMGDDPDVKTGKPSPDIFLAAMRRFEGNIEPSNCLVFEDAPSGVAAAKNAGMYAVMVPDPRLDVSYHKGADQVLSSLLDFKPGEWGLPPFTD